MKRNADTITKSSKIMVGDFIYRIYPSGKKVIGIAANCNWTKLQPLTFEVKDREKEWNGFYCLENYDLEGGVSKFSSYELGSKSSYQYVKTKRTVEYLELKAEAEKRLSKNSPL
jgi:hypothetical protein